MPSGTIAGTGRRSDAWFHDPDMYGFVRRAFAKSMGLDDADLARPIIGIAQTHSDLNNCNNNFRELAEYVKRGVWQAGGTPLEFPTISLGELFMRPTTMLYRNLMAMDTEEMIRAHPLDGVVLLGNCDKTTPAQLMGAASANIPSIMLTGGPHLSGRFRGESLGACSDCRRFWAEYRAGTIDADAMAELEEGINRSDGHCTVMGTASTMAAMAEALGMALPGTAAIPAPDARRLRLAEAAGRQIVATVQAGIRPGDVLTPRAFENAIRLMMALGGSTNAVIHLTAIAGRRGIPLPLELFDRISRETPFITNLRPSGTLHMEQLFDAGGVPAVMKELARGGMLHLDERSITGRSIGEQLESAAALGTDASAGSGWYGPQRVVFPLEQPLAPQGGIAILRGNLAPDGAVVKQTAVSPGLMRHRGQAIVFSSMADLAARIDDPALDVTADSVLVLQNGGPKGAPGMPEAGGLPIPRKLLAQGVRDMLRISDARMSGTGYGAVVLHVAPEAAVGGPLGLVRTGDWIQLDVAERRLHLEVTDDELAHRRRDWQPPASLKQARGYTRMYIDHVQQADSGADFDFLLGGDN
ncbi:MAG: dihydroxy-acid dehydratase [Chloroflexota bacterium]|nr:dihydroxy-acid dehydratase [Chloroflexota bacterium]